MNQSERASHFRKLHEDRPLVLPNAWDAASARVIERAGAQAIATTSAGVSWTHGRVDGEKLSRDEMLEVIRRIVAIVDVPVNADVEGGYGDVGETIRALIAIGAAGANVEDNGLTPEEGADRIRTARAAGGNLVINARVDDYLFQIGAPETRFDEAVKRANFYRAAGADCVFVPGVIDSETIAALVRAIDGPLNIMAMPGAPTVSELAQLGVARVSVGPAIAQIALAATQRAARELLEHGTYGRAEDALPFSEIRSMFR